MCGRVDSFWTVPVSYNTSSNKAISDKVANKNNATYDNNVIVVFFCCGIIETT